MPLDIGLELIRLMLRDSGAWCRLEVEDVFAVHVGWDQYLYVGSSRPCQGALARARELGLFPEHLDVSAYDFEPEEEGVLRPGDDDFWAGLHSAVGCGRAGLLEEIYVQNASRWHRLTCDTIDTVRAGLAPRARLAVCPALSSDVSAVLGALFPPRASSRASGRTGKVRSTASSLTMTYFRSWLPEYPMPTLPRFCPCTPMNVSLLLSAVMPDRDGVVRARWRAEQSLSDLAR
ncbi:hypothetical protein [Streptomyces griseoviridis]|uniref:hypothetical protein n=1 Tax=Streptomyces griseoviridis TaxID=45398 RepID=UPI0033FF838D